MLPTRGGAASRSGNRSRAAPRSTLSVGSDYTLPSDRKFYVKSGATPVTRWMIARGLDHPRSVGRTPDATQPASKTARAIRQLVRTGANGDARRGKKGSENRKGGTEKVSGTFSSARVGASKLDLEKVPDTFFLCPLSLQVVAGANHASARNTTIEVVWRRRIWITQLLDHPQNERSLRSAGRRIGRLTPARH